MKILVTGAGGFIGGHLVRRLLTDGHLVLATDIKPAEEWWQCHPGAENVPEIDLRDPSVCRLLVGDRWMIAYRPDWVFHLAANMGGMGHISKYHAEIIRDNTLIDINMIEAARQVGVSRFLYSSSACVYPVEKQEMSNLLYYSEGLVGFGGIDSEPVAPAPLVEEDAYPANPQGAYGWQKLHTEHLCKFYLAADWLNTKIVRFHNTYGPYGSWNDGREKAPAALCRKIAEANIMGNPNVEVWGDGTAVRTYMHVDDCVEGLLRLMKSDYSGPFNLGRDRPVTVDELADAIAEIAGIEIEKVHIEGPVGVQWRNSDNTRCREFFEWEPSIPIEDGLVGTYEWIEEQVLNA
jgi:nucleoside-diphosphate-sugar epimerase